MKQMRFGTMKNKEFIEWIRKDEDIDYKKAIIQDIQLETLLRILEILSKEECE